MLSLPSTDRVVSWADENLRPFGLVAAVLGGVTFYLALLAWAWQHTSYDVWGAVLIAPLLIGMAYPVARFAAHQEQDETMVRLVIGALVLKLFMTIVRYVVAFGVYGTADSKIYHRYGTELAAQFRGGDFDTNGAALSGTGFIKVFTGIVYTLTGPTMIGGYLVYAFLGFWGLYFFYRAFRIAVPDGDHRRYARLVFLLPSMLYWPSSIGKDAWMCLWLGVAALGAAKALAGQRGAFPIMALGITGCAFVRPHVALLFFLGISVAYLVRPGHRRSLLGPFAKVFGIVALLVSGFLLLSQVESYFAVDDLSEGGTTQALDIATDRSGKGGSQFQSVTPTSPTTYAYAVLTVLYRPLPNEAGNFQGLLASAEATLMLVLTVLAVPRIGQLLLNLRRWSYGTLALFYTLFFCYAFASISNFGILTRQRVQVLPFLLVLICLPRRPSVVPTEVEAAHAHR